MSFLKVIVLISLAMLWGACVEYFFKRHRKGKSADGEGASRD